MTTSRFASIAHSRPIPMFTAVGSVLLMLGTWFGQSGHAGDEAYAGSEAQPGSMSTMPGMANMPGMVMPRNSGGPAKPAPDASSMSGSMSGMDTSAPVSASGAAGSDDMAGMKMDPADPMAGMNMSTENMAAMMPGGYHLDCKASTCKLIISDSATSAISILGLQVKLAKIETGTVSLRVNGKSITVGNGRQTKVDGVTIKVEKISARESTLRLTKGK